MADTLQSARARQRGYFRPRFVDRLVAEHLSGRRDHTSRLWPLLMFELWHRRYLDGSSHDRAVTQDSSLPFGRAGFSAKGQDVSDSALPSASPAPVVVALRLLSNGGVPRGRPYPIAFLLTSFDVGGTERQMVELIRRLDRSEFDVHVACFHRRGALESLVAGHVASIATFPIHGFGRPATVRQWLAFARWCRHINARVVHTCELYANIFGLPAAALAGVDVRIGNRRELVTPGQDARSARLPAAGIPSRPCRRRQLGGGRRAAPPRRRPGREDSHDLRTASTARRSPAAAIARPADSTRRDGRQPAAGKRPRHAHSPPRRIVDDSDPTPSSSSSATDRCDASLRASRCELRGLGSQRAVPRRANRRPGTARVERSLCAPLTIRSESERRARGHGRGTCRSSRLASAACPSSSTPASHGLLVEPDRPAALAAAVLDLMDRPQFASGLGRAAREKAERQFSFDRMVSGFEHFYLSELGRRAVRPRT